MNDYEIRVAGGQPAHKPDGPIKRNARIAGSIIRGFLSRPRLVIVSAISAILLFAGTPHIGWDYQCRHPVRYGQPCHAVSYCAYYGIQGRQLEFPETGESCKPVTFRKIDWAALVGMVWS